MPAPRHVAFGIAGQAGPAHFRPDLIDPARGMRAHFTGQRRAAIALAAHTGQPVVDEFFRNEIELRVILGGEARPVAGIRTAGATGLARVAVV